MRRLFATFISLILILSLNGCSVNFSKYIRPGSKPNSRYYTNEIMEKINEKKSYTIKIFDLDLYRYYTVSEKEHSILPEFINSLNADKFEASIDTDKPKFKVIVEFSDSKYIINTYNDKLISIHPWDGIYNMDTVSIDGVSDYYNIYKFCEYIKKVSSGFEG